jgi:transposase InsO family protein
MWMPWKASSVMEERYGRSSAAAVRASARGTRLLRSTGPNDLWCADFKEEFKLGNGYCGYRLTVTDHASRALIKP